MSNTTTPAGELKVLIEIPVDATDLIHTKVREAALAVQDPKSRAPRVGSDSGCFAEHTAALDVAPLAGGLTTKDGADSSVSLDQTHSGVRSAIQVPGPWRGSDSSPLARCGSDSGYL